MEDFNLTNYPVCVYAFVFSPKLRLNSSFFPLTFLLNLVESMYKPACSIFKFPTINPI